MEAFLFGNIQRKANGKSVSFFTVCSITKYYINNEKLRLTAFPNIEKRVENTTGNLTNFYMCLVLFFLTKQS